MKKQVADKCAFRTLQMSSMRNSNLVVAQFSVYRILSFFVLDKIKQVNSPPKTINLYFFLPLSR